MASPDLPPPPNQEPLPFHQITPCEFDYLGLGKTNLQTDIVLAAARSRGLAIEEVVVDMRKVQERIAGATSSKDGLERIVSGYGGSVKRGSIQAPTARNGSSGPKRVVANSNYRKSSISASKREAQRLVGIRLITVGGSTVNSSAYIKGAAAFIRTHQAEYDAFQGKTGWESDKTNEFIRYKAK